MYSGGKSGMGKTSSKTALSNRILHISFVVFTFAAAAVMLHLVWMSPTRRLLWLVTDDSFYYFQTARNMAAGLGSTFDGINKTNGYHPLWFMLCVLAYKVVPGMYAGLRAVLSMGAALWVASALLLWAGLRDRGSAWALFAVLSFFMVTLRMFTYLSGMETGLLDLSLILLFCFTRRGKLLDARATARDGLALGALITLAVFSRLDWIFLIPGLAMVLAVLHWRDGFRRLVSRWASVFILPALALVAYMVLNKHVFGTYMPVSGMLKSSFPHPHFHPENITSSWSGAASALAVGIATIWVIVLLVRHHRTDAANDLRLLFVLDICVILHLGYVLFFLRWAVFSWYFEPYMLVAILNAAMIGSWLFQSKWLSKRSSLVWAVMPLFAVAALGIPARYYTRLVTDRVAPGWTHYVYDAALWARANTPPDAVFGMTDAGTFGYFSDRRVVNLDGIVNNLEYQEYGSQGRLHDYLRKVGVTYFASHGLCPGWETEYNESGEVAIGIPCHLHERAAGEIRLRAADLVYQSAKYTVSGMQPGQSSRARIWRYSPSPNTR